MEQNELTEIKREVEKFPALPDKIATPEIYKDIGDWVVKAKGRVKEIKEKIKKPKKIAEIAYKNWITLEKEAIEPYQAFIEQSTRILSSYTIEQKRLQAIKEEELRQEAIKKDDEEKLRLAEIAEKEGNKDEAEAILNEETFTPPPVVQSQTPKVSGLAMRVTWKHKVTNLMALIMAASKGNVPMDSLQPNDIFLAQQARALKGTVKYGGVEFYEVKSIKGVRQ